MKPPTSPSSQPGDNAPVDRVVQPCKETTEMVVKLVSDDGFAVPEAAFEIEFEDGSTRGGHLGLDGTKLLEDVPDGKAYRIFYSDEADVRAKIMAARLDDGLSSGSLEKVLGVLASGRGELERVAVAYQRYFGGEMKSACRSAFAGEPALDVLLAHIEGDGAPVQRHAPEAG